MKYTWIFLILAFFFAYISSFLVRTQSPWDKEKLNADFEAAEIETNDQAMEFVKENLELGLIFDYLNLQKFLLVSVFIGLTISCGFSSIHVLIDKLLFRKFYEDPNWKAGLRRGGAISLALFLLVVLRLMAGLTLFTAIPLILLVGVVEYALTLRGAKPKITASNNKPSNV